MVQPEIFSDLWYKDDFLIPLKKEDRTALRLKLEQQSHMGEMLMPGAEGKLGILKDRIAMLEVVA